jgi:hypothetical protein
MTVVLGIIIIALLSGYIGWQLNTLWRELHDDH